MRGISAKSSMAWKGYGWMEQLRRFQLEDSLDMPKLSWKRAYWFENQKELNRAKSFLRLRFRRFEAGFDFGSNEYFLLTNYVKGYERE